MTLNAAFTNQRTWTRYLVLFGLLIALAQLTDPPASGSALQTAGFWVSRGISFFASLLLAEWLLHQLGPERLAKPGWLKPAVLAIVFAALPLSLAEFWLESIFPQPPAFDDSALREQSLLLAFLSEYFTVLSVLLPLHLLLWVVLEREDRPAAAAPTGPDLAEPNFLTRTEGMKLADVIALSAQEHYVKVHTHNRSELVYARFSDLINEMPATSGTRVHRSWWVADQGVAAARRGPRRYRLTLIDGTEVPVSDTYLKSARARGLLRRRDAVGK